MTKTRDKMFAATSSFVTHLLNGEPVTVIAGRDLFWGDHELVQRFPDNFSESETHTRPDVEDASAAPGRKRGAKA